MSDLNLITNEFHTPGSQCRTNLWQIWLQILTHVVEAFYSQPNLTHRFVVMKGHDEEKGMMEDTLGPFWGERKDINEVNE